MPITITFRYPIKQTTCKQVIVDMSETPGFPVLDSDFARTFFSEEEAEKLTLKIIRDTAVVKED